MDDTERQRITAAVERAMHSFEQAERERNAEALIAHFARVPEFHIFSDGNRLSYDAMAAFLRETFPTLRAIEGGFIDLNIAVLAPDTALATGTFREATTDASGHTTRVRGAASWLWREIDGRWLIVYGHADHQPDTPGPEQDSSAIARELERIEQQLAATWKAGDCAGWGAMLAPDWSVTHISAEVISKAEALDMCKAPRPPFERFEIDNLSIRTFGDAAVVTGRTAVTTGDGNPTSLTLRFTDVFVRRAGRWQVVASHATQRTP